MTVRLPKDAEMHEKINQPIFVVGSPRSGTSILTWCLGQHPNMFPVPESNWMGEFAVNIASSYQVGAARDNRTILSAMDISRAEFFANFGHAINDLILGHRKHLERKRNLEGTLNRKHSTSEPKARWVDGTPEYSLHIHGLRKLFPEALFIHIVRDVESVVRSMLNFHRVAGTQLVTNEEQAYKYWLRTVDACLKAEQSYGPRVIYRLQYAALIDNPEAAIRSLLDFLGEPYSAKCLEPLAQRINSSNVPVDFKSGDPATDRKVVEVARRLYAEIQQTPQPAEGSPAVADQLEAAFQEPYLKATRLQQELSEEIAKVQHYAAESEQYKLQLGRQERHYTGEIDVLKSQVARQEQHYTGEIDVLKSQVARQEQHYTGEITRQEQHYTAEIEEYKSQIARLHKQLQDAGKLSRLLDNVENVAERLSNSRRWKLANVGAVIKAKLSHGKVSTGYDPLDKIVAAYSRWRASHPEIGKLGEEIDALESQAIPKTPAIEPKKISV
ncbi:MAG TPA: sulfotransferase [Candidatus Udaeobacter sp.]